MYPILTLGQYLQPTFRHLPVNEFVKPEKFSRLKEINGLELGFRHVESGPLVRSSYHAAKAYSLVHNFFKVNQNHYICYLTLEQEHDKISINYYFINFFDGFFQSFAQNKVCGSYKGYIEDDMHQNPEFYNLFQERNQT